MTPPPAYHERGVGVWVTRTPLGGRRGYLMACVRGEYPLLHRKRKLQNGEFPSQHEKQNRVGVPPHVP